MGGGIMPTADFLKGKQQITLYPTQAQHKKLKDLAAKRGKNLSTYILDSAFRDEKIHEKLDKIIVMLENKTEVTITSDFKLTELKEKVKEKPKMVQSFAKGTK
jgi:uncharacterized protein (DUF1778 family)